jgi:uncharacterized protein YprB with RNaseH-like and TPR domain
MIKNTFCHVPGIASRTERQLWSMGIHSWDSLWGASPPLPFGVRKADSVRHHIERSISALNGEDITFFTDALPSQEHWRLFPEFRNSVVYLDIETTGTGGPWDYITTIATYDGTSVSTYVRGRNMDRFAVDIQRYRLIVTYNGKCFDIPFIQNALGVRMDQAHIDLRYVLKSLGYTGGLKGCEKLLGIERHELDGVDGYFAVLLWDEFQRNGNQEALESLLAYNCLDAVNLEVLMIAAYNLKVSSTPFAEDLVLATPSPPLIPFKADKATLLNIRNRFYCDSYIKADHKTK